MEIEAVMTKQFCQVPISTIYMEVFAWVFDVDIACDRVLIITTFFFSHVFRAVRVVGKSSSPKVSQAACLQEHLKTRGQMLKAEALLSCQKLPEGIRSTSLSRVTAAASDKCTKALPVLVTAGMPLLGPHRTPTAQWSVIASGWAATSLAHASPGCSSCLKQFYLRRWQNN